MTNATLPPPLQRTLWTKRLSLDNLFHDDEDDEDDDFDLLTSQVARAAMETGTPHVRRYSVAGSQRNLVLKELQHRESHHDLELHASLDRGLRSRSVSK